MSVSFFEYLIIKNDKSAFTINTACHDANPGHLVQFPIVPDEGTVEVAKVYTI
jgi:hypothetical protein